MQARTKKIQLIFVIYWLLLAYTIAALIFWFISLNSQNERMTAYRINDLNAAHPTYKSDYQKISNDKNRKTTQYIGEGVTFFLVILAGAIFIYRSVRRQLKQTLQQQNFMMAITHELKTPIAVAQLNLETLQKRKLDEAQQQRLINNTLQETVRLNSLCNNILLTSQIDAGGYRMTVEELNLSTIVENCIADFTNRYSQKEINKDIQPEIFINGDALLLQMAINNLIDNAIKYSPKTTGINISLKMDEKVNLSISDQGMGIREEDKKKIFHKFYRAGNSATKSAKGTGLGLYLTDRIIKAHSGKIEVLDNVPSGSVFSISLKSAEKLMA